MRNDFRSTSFKRRKRKKRLLLAFLFFLAALLLILGPAILSGHNRLTIGTIEVSGVSESSSEEVKNMVLGFMGGKYLGLYAKSNFLIFPKSRIEQALYENFPKISRLEIDTAGTKMMHIKIEERTPAFLYCQLEKECFYADEEGFIYGQAPRLSPGTYVIFEGKEEKNIGENILETSDFEKLSIFLSSLKGIGLEPIRVALEVPDAHITLLAGAKIISQINEDMERQFSNLGSVLSDPQVVRDGTLAEGDTVDLRFGNKVFYKKSQE